MSEPTPPKTVKSGFLFKQGGFIGAWKKRYFILTSDQLLTYYKTNQAKEYAVGQFSVQGAHVQRESTRANAFSIQLAAPSHPDQPGRKYMLYAEQPADVDSWFKVLPVSAAAAAAAASAASPKSDKSAGDSKSKGGKSDGKESDGKSNGKGEAKSRRATTLLRTYDKPIKEGLLTKLGGKEGAVMRSWQERWFELYPDHILYFKKKSDPEPAGEINLIFGASIDSELVDSYSKKCCFSVTPNAPPSTDAKKLSSPGGSVRGKKVLRKFVMVAESEEELNKWLTALRNTVSELMLSPDRRFSSVSQSPLYTYTHSRTKAGWLKKQGGSVKSWTRRFFVLSGDVLYYFKEESDASPQGVLQGRRPLSLLSLHNGSVTRETGGGGGGGSAAASAAALSSIGLGSAADAKVEHTFTVNPVALAGTKLKRSAYLLAASTAGEADQWVALLEKATFLAYSRDLDKKLAMEKVVQADKRKQQSIISIVGAGASGGAGAGAAGGLSGSGTVTASALSRASKMVGVSAESKQKSPAAAAASAAASVESKSTGPSEPSSPSAAAAVLTLKDSIREGYLFYFRDPLEDDSDADWRRQYIVLESASASGKSIFSLSWFSSHKTLDTVESSVEFSSCTVRPLEDAARANAFEVKVKLLADATEVEFQFASERKDEMTPWMDAFAKAK